MFKEALDRIPWEDEGVGDTGEYIKLNADGTRGFGYSEYMSTDEKGRHTNKSLRFFVNNPPSLRSQTLIEVVERNYEDGGTTKLIVVYCRISCHGTEFGRRVHYGEDGTMQPDTNSNMFYIVIDRELAREHVPMRKDLPPVIDTQETIRALYNQPHAGNFETPQLVPPSTS